MNLLLVREISRRVRVATANERGDIPAYVAVLILVLAALVALTPLRSIVTSIVNYIQTQINNLISGS